MNKNRPRAILGKGRPMLRKTPGQVNKENASKKLYIESNKKVLKKQVDAVLALKYKKSHVVLTKETPKALQNLGVPNKPLLMTRKHVYLTINKSGIYNGKKDNYHNLGKGLFLMIPNLLNKPILVYQSDHDKNDIIVFVNAVDKNKKPLMLPIRINGRGYKNYVEIEANIIKSAHGRNNIDYFINKNINNANLIFADNKKIRNLNLSD